MDELLFDKKEVFSVLNAEEAKTYINCKGYFGDTLKELQEAIENNMLGTLARVDPYTPNPFVLGAGYSLFLPANILKKAKVYRPFRTIEEFKKTLNISDFGEPIEYRDSNGNQYVAVWNGYLEKNDKLEVISLGGWIYTARGLFECCFEFFNEQTEEWQPFGILDEE